MFENIMMIFKKARKKETINKSKEAAKERLHLVLMQDRANVSVDFLDLMRQEIIEVIKKYIDIDERTMDVRLENKENEDGTQGAPALYANIPIINITNNLLTLCFMLKRYLINISNITNVHIKEPIKPNAIYNISKPLLIKYKTKIIQAINITKAIAKAIIKNNDMNLTTNIKDCFNQLNGLKQLLGSLIIIFSSLIFIFGILYSSTIPDSLHSQYSS